MATDVWTGTGSWTANPSNWSLNAAPNANLEAEIAGAVSLTANGVARFLQIDATGNLTMSPTAKLTIHGYLANAGAASLQGQVNLGGSLVNSQSGALTVAATTAATTVAVSNLVNNGALTIQGGAAPGAPQALLSVAGGAAGGF